VATIQSAGNLTASSVAGVLWTVASPQIAFAFLAAVMVIAEALILTTFRNSLAVSPSEAA
jgi:hypothetical protein